MFSIKQFAVTLFLSVIGVAYSYADNDWNLPTYDNVAPSVADGSTIRSFSSVEISLSREGFDAPVGVLKDKGSVTASFTAADGTKTTPSINPSVKSGKLVLTSMIPVAKQGELEIKVPAGIVNNLAMPVATMTPEDIIAEGGCTNGEITLHYTISPVPVKCIRVTNAKPVGEPQFLYNPDGTLQKDRYGNYAISYQWRDMINGKLIPDYDYISYIYFWFEEDFETILGKEGATIKNLSNGMDLGVAALEFKTGNSGDGHKYDIIQFRLSSENYLKSTDHQGLYEVTLPAGVARTKDGMFNEAFTFQFTYGDPSQAKQPEDVDLDKYIGKYQQVTEEGEMIVGKLENFEFAKEGDTYYVVNPNGVEIMVPVKAKGIDKFELPATKTSDYMFCSQRGGSVDVLFQEQNGTPYIYIDQFMLQNLKTADYQVCGVLYYQKMQGGAENDTIPTYDVVTPAIANGSEMRSFTSLEIALSREGFDAPIGILKDKGSVKASFTAADGTKTSPAVSASVKGGKLVLTSGVPVSQKGELDITIPAGLVNNLAMPVATMTPAEIIAEGGCTNAEITLHYTISPVAIKCVRVTNARPVGEPQFIYNADGTLQKDRYGNYAISYQWRDMIDAELIPDNDYVSYIYFWFEEDFETILGKDGAAMKNLSNGQELGVAALEFKTGNSGDGHKYDIIQFRISSEDWLKTTDHQGLYEVTIPAGIARTKDGMTNEAFTFQFKYGDPTQAKHEEAVDLDKYIGKYNQVTEEGEIVEYAEHFEFVKEGDTYYVVNPNDVEIKIPVKSRGINKFELPATKTSDYMFCSYQGGSVDIMFQEQGGLQYIYIDQYVLQDLKTANYKVYGVIYHQKAEEDAIRDINANTVNSSVMYNLAGQRISPSLTGKAGKGLKGIVIMNGKKMMVK